MRVGFVGLGAMGAPMARHLHARGLLSVVGNRSTDKADSLAAELGVAAGVEAQAFAACDVVMRMLSYVDASRGVWLGDNGALAGVRK